jgi:hypothetical protein
MSDHLYDTSHCGPTGRRHLEYGPPSSDKDDVEEDVSSRNPSTFPSLFVCACNVMRGDRDGDTAQSTTSSIEGNRVAGDLKNTAPSTPVVARHDRDRRTWCVLRVSNAPSNASLDDETTTMRGCSRFHRGPMQPSGG